MIFKICNPTVLIDNLQLTSISFFFCVINFIFYYFYNFLISVIRILKNVKVNLQDCQIVGILRIMTFEILIITNFCDTLSIFEN